MPDQSVRSKVQKWLDKEVSDTNFLDLLRQSLDQIRLELEDGEEPQTVDLSDHDDLHALFWKSLGVTFEFLGFKDVKIHNPYSISFSTVPNELLDLNFDSEEFIQDKVFGPDLEELRQYAGMIISQKDNVNYRVIHEIANFLDICRNFIAAQMNFRPFKLDDETTIFTAKAFTEIARFLGFKDLRVEYRNSSEDVNDKGYYIAIFKSVPDEIAGPIFFNALEYLKQKLELEKNIAS